MAGLQAGSCMIGPTGTGNGHVTWLCLRGPGSCSVVSTREMQEASSCRRDRAVLASRLSTHVQPRDEIRTGVIALDALCTEALQLFLKPTIYHTSTADQR